MLLRYTAAAVCLLFVSACSDNGDKAVPVAAVSEKSDRAVAVTPSPSRSNTTAEQQAGKPQLKKARAAFTAARTAFVQKRAAMREAVAAKNETLAASLKSEVAQLRATYNRTRATFQAADREWRGLSARGEESAKAPVEKTAAN